MHSQAVALPVFLFFHFFSAVFCPERKLWKRGGTEEKESEAKEGEKRGEMKEEQRTGGDEKRGNETE